jgi:hypothetical protein
LGNWARLLERRSGFPLHRVIVIDYDAMQGCPRVDWSVLKVNE